MRRVLQRNSLIPSRRSRLGVPAWRRFERYAHNDLWQIDGIQVASPKDLQFWAPHHS
jgi:hypothetical protein